MAKLFRRYGQEVLGMNARVLEYVNRVNTPTATKIANDKLATKKILQKANIPTPRLYAVIRDRQELKNFRWTKLPPSFVLKPNSSSGGSGIVVIFGRNKKGNWVKADKTEVFVPELRDRVLDILDGSFSHSHVPDVAFFEQRIKNHPELKHHSAKGIPDIRILIYNLFPVMAMLRLPTEESGGRANLHAGGIGVGIDLVHGITTTAIHHGRPIHTIPGKRLLLADIHLPFWHDILLIAVRTAQTVGLGFVGVDVAIDRDDGPVILEINARPGLEIQLANMTPLRSRLRRLEGLTAKTPEKAIRVALNLFGEEIEHEIEHLSGQTVLGIEEEVTIIDHDGEPHLVKAKIDTGAWRTTIDRALAEQYHLHNLIIGEHTVKGALGQDTRPVVELTMRLKGRTIKTQAFLADRSHMNYPMIIGRRDMSGFLVDPNKRLKKITPSPQKPPAPSSASSLAPKQ